MGLGGEMIEVGTTRSSRYQEKKKKKTTLYLHIILNYDHTTAGTRNILVKISPLLWDVFQGIYII